MVFDARERRGGGLAPRAPRAYLISRHRTHASAIVWRARACDRPISAQHSIIPVCEWGRACAREPRPERQDATANGEREKRGAMMIMLLCLCAHSLRAMASMERRWARTCLSGWRRLWLKDGVGGAAATSSFRYGCVVCGWVWLSTRSLLRALDSFRTTTCPAYFRTSSCRA